jgi:uncharacterized damage-inducible protein DinB
MGLAKHLSRQARANRLANRRLHAALAGLDEAAFHAPRTGFFPSLAATLNHILAVDGYYLAALRGEPDMLRRWTEFRPAARLDELAARQAAQDEALIAHCDALDEACAAATVTLDRGEVLQHDRAADVLQHLFMHQTHHRGQAHAMLSGTPAAPPQLDEFLLASDAPLREADLRGLGWSEAQLFPPAPAAAQAEALAPLRAHLATLARYGVWATRRLAERDYRRDVGLFFGSVHGTLNHLLVAEHHLWFPRFAEGRSPRLRLDDELEHDRARLAERLESGARRWPGFVAALEDTRLGGTLAYVTTTGQPAELPFAATLAHVFNHGSHHRGQISAALTALGQPAPELDLVLMLQAEARAAAR